MIDIMFQIMMDGGWGSRWVEDQVIQFKVIHEPDYLVMAHVKHLQRLFALSLYIYGLHGLT